MSAWTPERQVRYERAKKRSTLGWRCLLCNRELRSTSCPHSRYEQEHDITGPGAISQSVAPGLEEAQAYFAPEEED